MRPTPAFVWTFVVATTLVSNLPTAAAESESFSKVRLARSVADEAIDNFGQVNDHYYRGEQPDREEYAVLAALGIRTVIDLQADGENFDEAQLVEAAGMTFYRIPMTAHVPPTPNQLALFLTVVTDPARLPVYVHCKAGKHRTGVMTAIYRMEHDDWTADQAFDEMKRYRYGWDFLHPEFKRFVFRYEPRDGTDSAGILASAKE